MVINTAVNTGVKCEVRGLGGKSMCEALGSATDPKRKKKSSVNIFQVLMRHHTLGRLLNPEPLRAQSLRL